MTDFTKIKKLFESNQEKLLKEQLVNFDRRKLKRKEVAGFASIARQLGMSNLGIKTLNPIIRSEKILEVAKDNELIEYGSCLYRVGLVNESQKILTEINKDRPQKILYLAFCKFAQWKYSEAITLLERYLKLSSLTKREEFIGQLNLASAYIFKEDFDSAEQLLSECESYASHKKLQNFLGNINELKSQIYFYQGQFFKAKKYLKIADSFFEDETAFGKLFVHKWLALISFRKNKAMLKEVRKEAIKQRHWETLRSLRYYEGHLLKNKSILNEVYLGTPFKEFKLMIKNKNPFLKIKAGSIPFGGKSLARFDRVGYELKIKNRSIQFKGHALDAKLLLALSDDFYRPKSGYQIFEKLYPNEFFHPQFSLNKTQKIISRFKKKKFGIISKLDKLYYLDGVRVHYSESSNKSDYDFYFEQIKSQFNEPFSAKDFGSCLKLSHRQTNRIIRGLLDEERIVKIGGGRSTRYFF